MRSGAIRSDLELRSITKREPFPWACTRGWLFEYSLMSLGPRKIQGRAQEIYGDDKSLSVDGEEFARFQFKIHLT
jgi:hypothetical protein